MDVSLQTTNFGQKKKINMNDVIRVPLSKRDTIRSTAIALSIPNSTLYSNFQFGEIRRHRNVMQPFLTFANVVEREQFCKANIKDDKTTFHDVMNLINIDEIWFYLTKNSRRYNLGVQRSEPNRTKCSKNYCSKVMFLAADP